MQDIFEEEVVCDVTGEDRFQSSIADIMARIVGKSKSGELLDMNTRATSCNAKEMRHDVWTLRARDCEEYSLNFP
jgi:hypothetical protein